MTQWLSECLFGSHYYLSPGLLLLALPKPQVLGYFKVPNNAESSTRLLDKQQLTNNLVDDSALLGTLKYPNNAESSTRLLDKQQLTRELSFSNFKFVSLLESCRKKQLSALFVL